MADSLGCTAGGGVLLRLEQVGLVVGIAVRALVRMTPSLDSLRLWFLSSLGGLPLALLIFLLGVAGDADLNWNLGSNPGGYLSSESPLSPLMRLLVRLVVDVWSEHLDRIDSRSCDEHSVWMVLVSRWLMGGMSLGECWLLFDMRMRGSVGCG
ncbi:hypothetical protein Salat_1154700 [Sesamum alatum]|uniref:Uncharacterized protein n=1 Tax=Sesamum alatum TaxID=300844 RepID=A0AAE1YEB7_9LAMI|nr:hypothetical protein Salat_1154700 [Sesamum alatum]